MYLLDTHVVSELRQAKGDPADHRAIAWAESASAAAILEPETGVLLQKRRDPLPGAVRRGWPCHNVLPGFVKRILDMDVTVALRCASLRVPAPRPHWNALIAATALIHGMTTVTRNRIDFKAPGVKLLHLWLPETA